LLSSKKECVNRDDDRFGSFLFNMSVRSDDIAAESASESVVVQLDYGERFVPNSGKSERRPARFHNDTDGILEPRSVATQARSASVKSWQPTPGPPQLKREPLRSGPHCWLTAGTPGGIRKCSRAGSSRASNSVGEGFLGEKARDEISPWLTWTALDVGGPCVEAFR